MRMTKEEYAQTFERICSSQKECSDCLMRYHCGAKPERAIYSITDVLEKLEVWAEENPIKTNRDKFEEVFGIKTPRPETYRICSKAREDSECCIGDGGRICTDCYWWDEEYIEPEKRGDKE